MERLQPAKQHIGISDVTEKLPANVTDRPVETLKLQSLFHF